MRGETNGTAPPSFPATFQSTRPLRGETNRLFRMCLNPIFQSTRPLRGETGYCVDNGRICQFSIHSPLAGRDSVVTFIQLGRNNFQSTRPLRGETPLHHGRVVVGRFSIHSPLAGRDPPFLVGVGDFKKIFNPLAPCGARLFRVSTAIRYPFFNPLAPCGARHIQMERSANSVNFQSTRPLRGETFFRSPS